MSEKAYLVRKGQKKETSLIEIEEFLSKYQIHVLDIGAGDAKGSLRYARSHRDVGIIALDLSWDAFDKSSKSAARKYERGGAENIAFLCANAFGISRYILAENNEKLITSLAATLKDGAEYEIVINSEIWRENLPKHLAHLGEITPDFFVTNNSVLENFGFALKETRYLTNDEIKELDTTWSARLMSSRTRANFVMAKAVYKKID